MTATPWAASPPSCAWLRTLLNLAVIIAFCGLLFGEGARMGEGDVTYAEIALHRKLSDPDFMVRR